MVHSAHSETRSGEVLAGRYRLGGLIARGGMADVFEAHDELLSRRVAIKRYRGAAVADRERFASEVHTLASLSHPGLVQVYDAGEHDGEGYVVLELVDGPTLREVLAERGALPSPDAQALGAAMAEALAFVHARGVVHRDVTPSNILCGADGRPRLADFGVARLLDSTRITAPATAIGTAAYMAPEQLEGHAVGPPADVYALGLVLQEALTNRPAFDGAGHEVALARLARDPDVETGVPGRWHKLLRQMTARDPAARPAAAAVAQRLAPPVAGVPVAVVVPTPGLHGSGPAGSTELTQPVRVAEGTMVMPAALHPSAEPAQEPPDLVPMDAKVRGQRALWLAAALIAGALVLAAVLSGGSGLEPPATSTPVSETTLTTAPTTTAPPSTEADDDDRGKGEGERKGKGRGGDGNGDD